MENMPNTLAAFRKHRRIARVHGDADQSIARLHGFYEWMVAQDAVRGVIDELRQLDISSIIPEHPRQPPELVPSTHEEIVAVGLWFLAQPPTTNMRQVLQSRLFSRPGTRSYSDMFAHTYEAFVDPALNEIEERLQRRLPPPQQPRASSRGMAHPPAITESLARFTQDHPVSETCFFIMMNFQKSNLHAEIADAVKATLKPYGLRGLRADDREYHEDLFPNVQTYMHGCGYGIAIFERIESDLFSPNVSLEVGYMQALRRPVCILKERTVKLLHADLMSKLYRDFDQQDVQGTLVESLEAWLRDKDIINV